MTRTRHPAPQPARDDLGAALATLSVDELLEVVCGMLLVLDEKAHSRVMNWYEEGHAARRGPQGHLS